MLNGVGENIREVIRHNIEFNRLSNFEIIEGKVERMGKRGLSIIAQKIKPLSAQYRTDTAVDIKPFTERRRIAGQRSFVRSGGV